MEMISATTNHLWQSTVFVVMAGLLSLAFRRNRAQVRYWLWFSASVKFLVPFALLLTLGGYLGRLRPVTSNLAVPAITYTFEQVTEPFPSSPPPALPTRSSSDWVPIVVVGLWACGFAGIALMRLRGWLRIRAAVRSSHTMDIPLAVPVRSTPSLLEPGVVGFFRPVLLLPTGIVERLAPNQLQVVLAHELCHVRRRDNLTAAVHMIVEAVFWFHPLVWWVSARLMEERERACDEAVLESGSEPQLYAESILKTCEFCVESPVACVSGVTGADLKKRIVRIMTELMPNRLSSSRKLLLAAVGMAAIAGPVVFGLAGGAQTRSQSTRTTTGPLPSFEVASIKRSRSGENTEFYFLPNRLVVRNCFIDMLVECAYGHDLGKFGFIFLRHDQLVGGPGWIQPGKFGYEGYDIDAKVDDSLAEKFGKDCGHAFDRGPCGYRKQMLLMLQSLLADRFKLKVRRETKQGSVYALVTARGGPKFFQTKFDVPDYAAVPQKSTLPPTDRPPCPGGMVCAQLYASMAQLALLLARQPQVGRPVIDQTGLQGGYYIKLQYAREPPASSDPGMDVAPPIGPAGPSLFTALQEQLGLKLVSAKGPVDVLVIDHVERPSEN